MKEKRKTQLIILAGGAGERFGGDIPKQFVKIAGKTIIEHTIVQVEKSEAIDSVIIVIHKSFYDYMNELILKNHFTKVKKIVIGGKTRQESSFAGICACDEDTDNVLLHDAIRPFVSEKIIEDIVKALEIYGAVDVAIKCADTIIQIDEKRLISDIPKRKYLMRGQTPQGFKKAIIEEAYRRFFKEKNLEVTDDCGIVKYYGLSDIYVVDGNERNLKITYQEDIYLADRLFQIRSVSGNMMNADIADATDILSDKVGVLFGASNGIGADIQQIIKSSGCKIYGFSRKNGCDICDHKQVANALRNVYEREGRIDYCINTAGELRISKLENMTIENIDTLINVNYKGVANLTKEILPYLRQSQGSLILFTSSSYTRGRAMYSIYSSAKAAVVNFAQAVAEETMGDGIRINVINPERTSTSMRRKNFGYEPEDTLLSSRKVAEIAIKVIGADYTGQVIDVRKNG